MTKIKVLNNSIYDNEKRINDFLSDKVFIDVKQDRYIYADKEEIFTIIIYDEDVRAKEISFNHNTQFLTDLYHKDHTRTLSSIIKEWNDAVIDGKMI